MASSGSISKSFTSWDTLKFNWWINSQSITNNTSNIGWNLQLIATGAGRISSTASKDYKIIVNGVTYSGVNWIGIANNKTKTLVSGSTNIAHNADGTKTFSFSFNQEIDITFSGKQIGNISGSGTGVINPIPRQATITAAPNFTDEENPTITYSNPAGSVVESLKACISFDGSKDDIPYRDIDISGTEYTFNLTEAEREILRKGTIDSNTRTIRFYVATVIGGVTYRNSLEKTLTIVNCNPTISPTIEDINPATLALTGDKNKFIKYQSNAAVSTGATAYKHATITSHKITSGNKSISTATGTINNIESAIFIVSTTDSRGLTATETINKTLIDYLNPSCNLTISAPTTDGDIVFNIKGNVFNGSFGAINNAISIEYRYKTNDSDWGEWTATAATFNGNTYNADVNLSGLDYRLTYTFQARVKDSITAVESAEKKVKTMPIFDWGENDFNFNIPIDNLTLNNQALRALLTEIEYPIGRVIHSTNPANPATYLGVGEWTQIKDVFLLAAGDTYEAGNTGGSAEANVSAEGFARIGLSGKTMYGHMITGESWSGNWQYTESYTKAGTGTFGINGGPSVKIPSIKVPTMPPYKSVYIWERTA